MNPIIQNGVVNKNIQSEFVSKPIIIKTHTDANIHKKLKGDVICLSLTVFTKSCTSIYE